MYSRCDYHVSLSCQSINTLRPRQNGRHFADDIFKCMFFNENAWIPIKISPKFVPLGPINKILALVQIMAWRRLGDKPLSEPMMFRLPTHICVTRPQWVNVHINLTVPNDHYSDVIISAMVSQIITSLTLVYWTIYSGANQIKHQSSASLAFVRGIYRWPMCGCSVSLSGSKNY